MNSLGFILRGEGKDTLELDVYDIIGESWWSEGVSAKNVRRKLKDSGAKVIKARINSRGGDVVDGLAIYNDLKDHPARVEVSIIGVAASMASVIAMAGDEITIAENALVMIHNPWGVSVGEADDHRAWADVLDKMRDSLLAIYTSRTKQSRDDVQAMMAKETWLDAAEAKRLGFADKIAPNKGSAKAFAYLNLSGLEAVPEHLQRAVASARLEINQGSGQRSLFGHPPAPLPAPAPAGRNTDPETETMDKDLATILALLAVSSVAAAIARIEEFKTTEAATGVTGQAATARVRSLVKVEAATGKTGDEALGTLTALKEQAAKVPALEAQIATAKTATDKAELENLLAKGKADKKLSPAKATELQAKVEACFKAKAEMKQSGQIRDLTDDEWTLGQAKAYVEALPVNATLAGATPGAPPPAPPPVGSVAANGDEPIKHNGKAYEDMTGPERVKLNDSDKATFDLVRNDWVKRGEPGPKPKAA